MIVCPNCSRENEDHYKFCLGCGTELTGDDKPKGLGAPTAVPRRLGRVGDKKLRLASPLLGGGDDPVLFGPECLADVAAAE